MADKKILVVVDPLAAEKQPAVERAAWLAERTSASLELIVCDFDPEIDRGAISMVPAARPNACSTGCRAIS